MNAATLARAFQRRDDHPPFGAVAIVLATLGLGACQRAPAPTARTAGRYHLVGAGGTDSLDAPGASPAPTTPRLLPGFGVSIVEERTVGGRRFGRTARGRWLTMKDLAPARPTTFSGVVLGAADDPRALAWVLTPHAPIFADPLSTARPTGTRPLYARETLLAPCLPDQRLCHAAAGWIRRSDLRVPTSAPRPAGVGTTERWIDVDLAAQILVASEGDRPVFATLVSTGIGARGSPLATPEGVFRVRSKRRTATMDNLEHTGVVPYSYEDVPFVQYFTDRVALHAALWHDRFGHPASHGCINLAPADAERLFAFTNPTLAPGDGEAYVRASTSTVIRVRTSGPPAEKSTTAMK